MRIFSLVGDWYKSPIITVIAENFEKAVELGAKALNNACLPWNTYTVKTMWSFEVNFPFPAVINIHKPDADSSVGILWTLKNGVILSSKREDGTILAFTDTQTMFPYRCWFENEVWRVDPSTEMDQDVRAKIANALCMLHPNG